MFTDPFKSNGKREAATWKADFLHEIGPTPCAEPAKYISRKDLGERKGNRLTGYLFAPQKSPNFIVKPSSISQNLSQNFIIGQKFSSSKSPETSQNLNIKEKSSPIPLNIPHHRDIEQNSTTFKIGFIKGGTLNEENANLGMVCFLFFPLFSGNFDVCQ